VSVRIICTRRSESRSGILRNIAQVRRIAQARRSQFGQTLEPAQAARIRRSRKEGEMIRGRGDGLPVQLDLHGEMDTPCSHIADLRCVVLQEYMLDAQVPL